MLFELQAMAMLVEQAGGKATDGQENILDLVPKDMDDRSPIYIGSKYEGKMFKEFEVIEKEAHSKGLPVVTWIYPRGSSIKNDTSREMISYATRTALELGADIVKIKYGGNKNNLQWAVKSAGRTKVVVAGGTKKSEKEFLKQVKDIKDAGAIGLAIGRNVWQSKNPLELTKKIKKIIWKK